MVTRPFRKVRLGLAAAVVGVSAALAAVLSPWVGAASAAPGPEPVVGPAGDAFYTPPSPLPAGSPGDVIWYSPVTPTASLKPPAGTTVYKVLYLSTDAQGRRDAVSGSVYLPAKPAADAPIVGFAPGTIGLGDSCAPSKLLTSNSGINYNQLAITALLDKGWAVAETDYEGMGTPGDHTYVVGRSEGHAVIDAVRAATRLPQTRLSATAPVAFYGYSQGGGAAAWAGELQPGYAPGLKLVGIAAGGTPADLIQVAAKLDGSLGSGLEAAAAVGFNAAYPELNLDKYLSAKGKTAIADLRMRCVEGLVIKYPFKKISEYTTTNPLTQPDWQARLNQNKLGQSPPKVPIYLYHAASDELVALPQAQALRDTYCKAGVNVTWKQMAGEHASVLLSGQASAVSYVGDRFAGKPATSTCGQS